MKTLLPRIIAAALLAAIAWVLLAGASAPRGTTLEPDKLVILSTSDVKGKTDPCG
jgi:hypothetical protein